VTVSIKHIMRHRQVMAAIFLIASSITLPYSKGLAKFLSFSPNELATLDFETPKEFKVKRPEFQKNIVWQVHP
jgi:hypothetical protein